MKSFKVYFCILLSILLISSYIIPIESLRGDSVLVHPGFHDYKLGKDFPREDRVKLDYPKSTILINSTGELLFNVTLTTFNYTRGNSQESTVKSLTIYIPPEFTINDGVTSVWSSLTNDYGSTSMFFSTAFPNDPIAPNWSILQIFNLNITKSHEDVQYRIFLENNTQYIRLFNVTSPSIAGRYFFKVFITIGRLTYSIGSHNFPTIVVKAALNPAYISGVIRYGDVKQDEHYGKPLDATVQYDGTVLLPKGYGGHIYAEGLTADGERVQAQAYFNATSGGHYTLYGLAEGTYNITVKAAGYRPQKFLEVASVIRGQSLEDVDFYLIEGMNFSGRVFSKHGFNEIPWGYAYNITSTEVRRVIRIEITDLDEQVIASSPLRLFDKELLMFRPRDTLDPFSSNFYFSLKREVSFDGHIPQDFANYTSGILSGDYYVKAFVSSYIQIDSRVVHANNNTRKVETVIDLQRTSYLEVTVHFKDRQGTLQPAPTFVDGFLYLEVLDKTGAVVGFNISYVPKGFSSFTMQVRGIDIWNRLTSDQSKRTAWIFSHDRGLLPGTYTINALFMNRTIDFIVLNALILGSPELRTIFPTATGPLVGAFPSRLLEATNRETPLYFQLNMVRASTGGFCNSVSELSFDLVRGGGFNCTLYPIDWQRPSIIRKWIHPGSEIRIDIYTLKGDLIDTLRTIQPFIGKSLTISTFGDVRWEDGTTLFERALGLKSGSYLLKIYTPGYLEDSNYSPLLIPVTLGDVSDTRINLLKGAEIDLTVIFKTEHLFDPIDNKLLYARPLNDIDSTPVRVEVFDEFGEFVAANITYAKRGSDSLQVLLDGFNRYYGNPRILWTHFYDTTDAASQLDSGLDEGEYQIRVTIAGYYCEVGLLPVKIDTGNIESRPRVSLIMSMERLGYLYGRIIWVDWCGTPQPLSWGGLTAYSTNGFEDVYTYSLDGYYEMWLIPRRYDFGIHHPGFETRYFHFGVHISGGSATSITFFMN